MKVLTEIELKYLVSNKIADYSKEISLYVPLSGDQPIVMYTCLSRGIPSKHYLGLELKLQFSGGLHVYTGKPPKPFDITKHEFYDSEVSAKAESDGDLKVVFGERDKVVRYLNQDDAIAIAKALGVTAGDLKAAN